MIFWIFDKFQRIRTIVSKHNILVFSAKFFKTAIFLVFCFVLIPSRYLAKADCRAKPGGAYFLSVGDTVFSPPTTDARLTIQFISLPTFHLEGRGILVFLIKLPSFLKQIFHIYHFLEEKHFYKKNLVVEPHIL